MFAQRLRRVATIATASLARRNASSGEVSSSCCFGVLNCMHGYCLTAQDSDFNQRRWDWAGDISSCYQDLCSSPSEGIIYLYMFGPDVQPV